MAKEMTLEIKGKEGIIRFPIGKGTPSGSGKNTVVFSTKGNKRTDAEINGQPVTVGLNVYYPAED